MRDAFEERFDAGAAGHIDALSGLLFLDGELTPARALAVAAHAETCVPCSALLAALEHESRQLRRALTEAEAAVAPAAAFSPKRALWPALAIASLVAGAAWVWSAVLMPLLPRLAQGFGGGDLLILGFFDSLFWRRWGAALNSLQWPVLGALSLLVWMIVRSGGRRRWRASAGALLAALALAMPAPAHAAQTFHGQTYSLPAGQTLNNDLFVFADTVHIDGTVNGDVVSWARSLTVNGHVEGNVISFSKYLQIGGKVDGSVETFSDAVEITGAISRNVYGFEQHIELANTGRLGGGATLFCESADLEGTVSRDLMASVRLADLAGTVGGNVFLRGGNAELGPGARIGGRLWMRGEHPPVIAPGATIAGGWKFVAARLRPAWQTWHFYWVQILEWAAAFLVGWLWLALVPGFVRRSLTSGDQVGRSFAAGVAALVVIPLLALLLTISVVGLPLGLIALLLYAILLYLAAVLTGLWIGQGILGAIPAAGRQGWLALALGLALERAAVNLPYHVGFFAWVAIVIFGLGAQVMALHQSYLSRSGPPTITPTPALGS